MRIVEVYDNEQKATIANEVLRALPAWFGIETALVEYVKDSQTMPFYVAYEKGSAIGFVAIKQHNAYTAEVYVMGVLKEYHRQGIGKALIEQVQTYCLSNALCCLSVKTLAETAKSIEYEQTRKFYKRIGFIPLEIFPDLWDVANPCLFLIKWLAS